MEQRMTDAEQAFFDLFTDPGGSGLPIPRLGKAPLSAKHAQSLPSTREQVTAFRLSWVDEEDLGIRLFVTALPGPQGIEIIASIQGGATRPVRYGSVCNSYLREFQKPPIPQYPSGSKDRR